MVVLVAKKLLKFEENSEINIYSLVPQIDNPVALCRLFLRDPFYSLLMMDRYQALSGMGNNRNQMIVTLQMLDHICLEITFSLKKLFMIFFF